MLDSNNDYDAGTFQALADTPLGRNLWQFLNRELTIARMETATDLGKPAVTGIEEQLLRTFRQDVLDDRVKQMIGHMARQVMESRGYRIEQRNMTIASALFSKGSRYSRPDWQRLHVFRNSRNARELCFTNSRTATDLPPPLGDGTWRFWASFSTVLRGHVAYGVDVHEVRREIAEAGYALRQMKRILRPA